MFRVMQTNIECMKLVLSVEGSFLPIQNILIILACMELKPGQETAGWKNGEWALAGVLITGAEVADEGYSFAGVYAIGKNAWGRIISALGTVGALPGQLSGSFSLAGVPAATVNSGTIVKKFTVSGLVGFIDTMTLDLVINHSRRNDLRVELRSPSGATLTMFNLGSRSGKSAGNLVCTGKKIPGFRGFPANGVWILSVKDAYPGNGGTLVSASLGLTTR